MTTDVYNVWESLYEVMCIPCKHCKYCHGSEEEANDQQMVICIGAGQIIRNKEQLILKEDITNPVGEE